MGIEDTLGMDIYTSHYSDISTINSEDFDPHSRFVKGMTLEYGCPTVTMGKSWEEKKTANFFFTAHLMQVEVCSPNQ